MVTQYTHFRTSQALFIDVMQRHSPLFDCLGGWQHVVDGQVPAYGLKQFMSKEQHLVAAFLVDCSQRRWASSPAEHAEGLGDGASDVDEDEAIVAAALGVAAYPEVVLEDL
jgi:hypothetical protein